MNSAIRNTTLRSGASLRSTSPQSAIQKPDYRLPTTGYSFRRASVLVMVVGLLTIIAMLGTTFLLISRLDRRTAAALAKNTPADPIAKGIVAQIQSTLKEDLHIGGTPVSVYGGTTATNDFIDSPGTDDWLVPFAFSTTKNTATERDCTLEDVPMGFGETFTPTSPIDFEGTKQDDVWVWVATSGITPAIGDPTPTPADTDGDGWADAILSPTGVTNAEGQEYYAAVRVIDLSALINVNTAGDPLAASLPTFTSPVHIDLRTFLRINTANEDTGNNTLYEGQNAASPGLLRGRCGQVFSDTLVSLNTYYTQCASRPYSPVIVTPSYQPFSIGDEVFLRWAKSGSTLTNIGRLYQDTSEVDSSSPALLPLYDDLAKRRNLTTFNCSRILPRIPAALITNAAPEWNLQINLTDNTSLDDPPSPPPYNAQNDPKQALYNTLRTVINNDHQAAHLVANLWAYLDKQDLAYAFTPNNELTYTAYGVIPQPVIAEAYAYNIKDSGLAAGMPPNNDHGWAYAVELYNPTSTPITLNDGTTVYYKLVQGVKEFPFPVATATLAAAGTAGDRLVVYTVGGRKPTNQAVVGDETDYGFQSVSPWYEWADLDFSNQTDPVRLVRCPDGDGNTPEIVVDEVKGSDFGYLIANKKSQPNPPHPPNLVYQLNNGRRDDTSNHRALVGGEDGMADCASATGVLTDHKLGAKNDGVVWTTVLPLANVFGGFEIPIRGSGVVSVAEAMNMYITGPDNAGATLPGKLASDYANKVSRGRLELFNDAPATPGDLAPLGTLCAGSYPSVPQACIYAEMATGVPPDEYRSDDANLQARIYGKVNINTATREALHALPWPSVIVNTPAVKATDEVAALVEYIIAYRNRVQAHYDGNDDSSEDTAIPVDADVNYTSGGTNVPAGYGFKTPGELAIPLAQYAMDKGLVGTDTTAADYLSNRDALYNAVANLVTVNSDTYAAYIYVQIPDENGDNLPEYEARYLTVIDRSNCRTANHQPAVLLFTPIK